VTPEKPTQECSDPQIGALLVSYALGMLQETEAERFEHHLLHCSACQQELEESTPALETLASSREQFVVRAHKEKEDFESQFARLARDKQTVSRHGMSEKARGWIETIWTVLWGRKWVVGAAGAIAVLVLFGIRHGPESVSPPVVENAIPLKSWSSSRQTTGSVSDSQLASNDYGTELKPENQLDVSPAPAQVELNKKRMMDISAKTARTSEPEQPRKSEDTTAERMVGAAEQVAEVQSEIAPPRAAGSEDQVLVPSAQYVQTSGRSFPPADLMQLAETALGTFDPEQYEYPSPTSKAGSSPAIPELARSLDGVAEESSADEVATADALFARRRYGEARDLYERKWKEDSTDVRLQVMAGVASLAQGDNERARTALELAYRRLPSGAQKDDVGLLLARADILAGRLNEARNRLQDFLGVASDPDRKEFAQRAIATMDSFENAHGPKQAPK
jgi:tetratricopeptide (TPR) repeat protein